MCPNVLLSPYRIVMDKRRFVAAKNVSIERLHPQADCHNSATRKKQGKLKLCYNEPVWHFFCK